MAMIVQCDNQKCAQLQEAQLEIETNNVICAECGNVIKSISSFAKNTLKSLGQTTRNHKSTETYAIKCPSCSKTGQPKLNKEQIICAYCKKEFTALGEAFKLLLRTALKNANTDL